MDDGNYELELGVQPIVPAAHFACASSRASSRSSSSSTSDADLLVALRAGRTRSLRVFYVRFRPVLHEQAHRLGVRHGERDELVGDFLADITLRLIEAKSAPQSLAAYVITAFRHFAANVRRAAERRGAYAPALSSAHDVGEHAQGVAHVSCSEYSLRAMLGAFGEDESAPHPAVAALAAHLFATAAERDRELLTWLGERVPVSAIAAWRGTTLGATKMCVSRLRARLRRAAGAYVAEAEGEARCVLVAFFRRAGITLVPSPPPPPPAADAVAVRLPHLRDVASCAEYASPYGPGLDER